MENTTQLAYERNKLAYERTLMAWIRTSFSLISFGFTIYKYFEFQTGKDDVPVSRLLSPREFGMTMITIGIVALILATIEDRRAMARLAKESGTTSRSVAVVVASLVSVMGVIALVVVFLGG